MKSSAAERTESSPPPSLRSSSQRETERENPGTETHAKGNNGYDTAARDLWLRVRNEMAAARLPVGGTCGVGCMTLFKSDGVTKIHLNPPGAHCIQDITGKMSNDRIWQVKVKMFTDDVTYLICLSHNNPANQYVFVITLYVKVVALGAQKGHR